MERARKALKILLEVSAEHSSLESAKNADATNVAGQMEKHDLVMDAITIL